MKFKVGQRYRCDFTHDDRKGNIIEITSVIGNFVGYKVVKTVGHIDNLNTFEIGSMFGRELKPLKNECIVIYRKANTVIALDKSTGEKAIAKCSPEDEFNFMTGAELAFDRLSGRVSVPFEPLKLLNTKICVISESTRNITKGKIYEIKDGYFMADTGSVFPIRKPLTDIEDLKEYLKGEVCRTRKRDGYFSDTAVEFIEVVE